jgi:hypothetical protein
MLDFGRCLGSRFEVSTTYSHGLLVFQVGQLSLNNHDIFAESLHLRLGSDKLRTQRVDLGTLLIAIMLPTVAKRKKNRG